MKIFTPQDAKEARKGRIPEFVFNAFNELLSEKYNAQSIIITQDEAIDRIQLLYDTSDESLSRRTIFDQKWLDIEEDYRQNGWIVEYDKPGYNETYKPRFIFRPRT